nr:hypothetical protein B11C_100044 [Bartonella sp. 1-1C]
MARPPNGNSSSKIKNKYLLFMYKIHIKHLKNNYYIEVYKNFRFLS